MMERVIKSVKEYSNALSLEYKKEIQIGNELKETVSGFISVSAVVLVFDRYSEFEKFCNTIGDKTDPYISGKMYWNDIVDGSVFAIIAVREQHCIEETCKVLVHELTHAKQLYTLGLDEFIKQANVKDDTYLQNKLEIEAFNAEKEYYRFIGIK